MASKWYAAAVPIVLAVQSLGFELVPGGKLKGEDLDFWQVMASTWPLSCATVAITLLAIHQDEIFEEGLWFWVSAAVIVIGAGAVGGVLVEPVAGVDPSFNTPQGWLFALAYKAGLALGAFAILYGWLLFVLSVGMSVWAGLWIEAKLKKSKI